MALQIAIVTVVLFLGGWIAVCFVTMDFSWPLSTNGSRLWLIVSFMIVVGLAVEDKPKGGGNG